MFSKSLLSAYTSLTSPTAKDTYEDLHLKHVLGAQNTVAKWRGSQGLFTVCARNFSFILMQTLKDSLLYELREEVSKTLNKLSVDTQLVSYTAEIPTSFLFNILPYSVISKYKFWKTWEERSRVICVCYLALPKGTVSFLISSWQKRQLYYLGVRHSRGSLSPTLPQNLGTRGTLFINDDISNW